jgi:hypothetical protein
LPSTGLHRALPGMTTDLTPDPLTATCTDRSVMRELPRWLLFAIPPTTKSEIQHQRYRIPRQLHLSLGHER